MLGVPLHTDHESGARQADRLDLAVRRHCFDTKPRGRPIDTLRVQRIDHQLRRSSERCQNSARGQRDIVSRTVWAVGRIFPGAVIEPAGKLVHSLVQGAAERDIQLLDATTNRQNREIAPNSLAYQR